MERKSVKNGNIEFAWFSTCQNLISSFINCISQLFTSIPFLEENKKAFILICHSSRVLTLPQKLTTLPFLALVVQMVKSLLGMQETRVWSLGQENPLEKEMAIHFSIFIWRIPWTQESGGLQSIGSQRIGYDWLQLTHTPFLAMTEYKCVGQSSSSYMRAAQKGKWPGWSKVQSDFTRTKLSKAYMKLVNTQLVRVNSRRIVKRIMKWHTIVFVFVCCFVFLE